MFPGLVFILTPCETTQRTFMLDVTGGGLDAIKARVAESKDEAFQARQRYDAHIREHGCESHKN